MLGPCVWSKIKVMTWSTAGTMSNQVYEYNNWDDVKKHRDDAKVIFCQSCKLKEFPELDFPNLLELSCSGNLLTKLPKLPPKLKELYCCMNPLTELPELPDSLELITCDFKNLTKKPILPKNLKKIYWDYEKYFGNNEKIENLKS